MSRGKNKTPVILLNTLEIFDSISEAAAAYHLSVGNIIKCCNRVIQSCGKTETKEKMVWRYYDEKRKCLIEPEESCQKV